MRPEYVFVTIAILSIVFGLPLADRRIPPNHWYGVRIPATFADPHVWYEANAQAGRELAVLGVLYLVVALALAGKLPPDQYVMWCGPIFVIGTLVVVLRSVRLANRLRRERGDDRPGPGPSPS